MRSLTRRSAKADPAPSRWAWRLQRLMLTPEFRFGLRVGLPFTAALIGGTLYFGNEARQVAIRDAVAETRASIQDRPEFMVQVMAIDGADAATSQVIRQALPLDFPTSSFDLDLEHIRKTVTNLDPVTEAAVRVKPGGVLHIDVTPRVPVAVWRQASGLSLIDASGAHVADIARRDMRADLPVVAGEGANTTVKEALSLVHAARPLGKRLRGIVRMGNRRWDVVLDRDQRVMLPEAGAVEALERVIALEGAQLVLTRDVARVDMRLAGRPTVRMNPEATKEWWRIRQIELNGQ